MLSCLSMRMKCACRVGACSVGCGRPGPVFGPVVPYFLPVVRVGCHTGLLLWLCRHPKLSTVWLAAAGVL